MAISVVRNGFGDPSPAFEHPFVACSFIRSFMQMDGSSRLQNPTSAGLLEEAALASVARSVRKHVHDDDASDNQAHANDSGGIELLTLECPCSS